MGATGWEKALAWVLLDVLVMGEVLQGEGWHADRSNGCCWVRVWCFSLLVQAPSSPHQHCTLLRFMTCHSHLVKS